MHVLLCEDNKEVFLHIEEIINREFLDDETEKIIIHIAETGRQAVYIANQFTIDVFIIDLDLPDMTGLDLAILLRKKYLYQPIIIESSCKNPEIKEKIQDKISYYAFLSKPFKNTHFLKKFRNAVELSKRLNHQELCIKINRNILKYDIQDIICIRKINSSKKVEIIHFDEEVQQDIVYSSIRKIMELMSPSNGLIQVHKSYLVNPIYIRQIDYSKSVVYLKYVKYSIPIGIKYSANLQYLL